MKVRRAAGSDLEAIVELQRAAYAPNRLVLGVEPLPLQADYADIMRRMEVWLAESRDQTTIEGVLILEQRADDLLVWSIATDPARQSVGLGRFMLQWAEQRARELGRTVMRLYTGTLLIERVAWYRRHGFDVERIEQMPDRSTTHMIKRLS